jgi:hypothetical protein
MPTLARRQTLPPNVELATFGAHKRSTPHTLMRAWLSLPPADIMSLSYGTRYYLNATSALLTTPAYAAAGSRAGPSSSFSRRMCCAVGRGGSERQVPEARNSESLSFLFWLSVFPVFAIGSGPYELIPTKIAPRTIPTMPAQRMKQTRSRIMTMA